MAGCGNRRRSRVFLFYDRMGNEFDKEWEGRFRGFGCLPQNNIFYDKFTKLTRGATMKQAPEDKFLNKNLRSSKFSANGFVGNDARTVDEIITADRRQMEEIGRTIEELVNLLQNAYDLSRQPENHIFEYVDEWFSGRSAGLPREDSAQTHSV